MGIEIILLIVLLVILFIGLIILGFLLFKLLKNNKNNKDVIDSDNLSNKISVNINNNINSSLTNLNNSINNSYQLFKDNLNNVSKNIDDFKKDTKDNILDFKNTTYQKIDELNNTTKDSLSNIKNVVDEKMESVISKQLNETRDNLIRSIENVMNAVGSLQNINNKVDFIEKALTVSKIRGVSGEIQLLNILEEILDPSQYVKNYKSRKNQNSDGVEFAIRLPGKDDKDIYLPIDSKFNLTYYVSLQDALNEGNKEKIEECRRNLKNAIMKNAKDIKEKYINPPTTTSFAIMFLPTEGLYAEVCNLNIIEELQRKFNITVTGPSTTIAYINALRMGFQTLAIKKQTNEIGKFAIALNNELKIYAESIEKAIAAMDKAKTQLQVDVSKRANILSSKINNIITTYEKIQDSESEQENN
ncbi:MAG: DNA recombination protein RmuC [Firmicutes bacterium]|nr:DNA recombination protein RmuC [Candidatus Alectryobacillus merdavium]